VNYDGQFESVQNRAIQLWTGNFFESTNQSMVNTNLSNEKPGFRPLALNAV
jgi:hypothetical protein